MFSDIVVEHGTNKSDAAAGDHAGNVYWTEKTTQTNAGYSNESVNERGSDSPSTISRRPSRKHRTPAGNSNRMASDLPGYSATGQGPGMVPVPVNGAGLTCQELLALSGALGAALPTPLALPTYTATAAASSAVSTAPLTDDPVVSNASASLTGNNNHLTLAPQLMPVLPTLAMSLWPEPFPGRTKLNGVIFVSKKERCNRFVPFPPEFPFFLLSISSKSLPQFQFDPKWRLAV